MEPWAVVDDDEVVTFVLGVVGTILDPLDRRGYERCRYSYGSCSSDE